MTKNRINILFPRKVETRRERKVEVEGGGQRRKGRGKSWREGSRGVAQRGRKGIGRKSVEGEGGRKENKG